MAKTQKVKAARDILSGDLMPDIFPKGKKVLIPKGTQGTIRRDFPLSPVLNATFTVTSVTLDGTLTTEWFVNHRWFVAAQ